MSSMFVVKSYVAEFLEIFFNFVFNKTKICLEFLGIISKNETLSLYVRTHVLYLPTIDVIEFENTWKIFYDFRDFYSKFYFFFSRSMNALCKNVLLSIFLQFRTFSFLYQATSLFFFTSCVQYINGGRILIIMQLPIKFLFIDSQNTLILINKSCHGGFEMLPLNYILMEKDVVTVYC